MKIVIDKNIPFLRGILEDYADVSYLGVSEINPTTVKEADALLIRSRTICGPELLSGSRVKFIGTATIGTDHIDTDWCENNGIKWVNAPGCNSGSVMQYITTSLLWLAEKYSFDLREKTLGIIGVGNVGTKVQNMAYALGMNVLLNDPPRERTEGKGNFVSFDDAVAGSDIVTFHVPLTFSGKDKTYGLASNGFFRNTKKGLFIINSSRGGVVDESLLLKYLRNNSTMGAVTDVWDGEPRINVELMRSSDISTPHIAGYSLDGKWNASSMIIEQFSDFFGLNIPGDLLPHPGKTAEEIIFVDDNDPLQIQIQKAVFSTYNITTDSSNLKDHPSGFEQIRNNYHVRREFHAYKIEGSGLSLPVLSDLGFNLV